MNIATRDRRFDVSRELIREYGSSILSLCWEDYYALVTPMAERLCLQALDDGLVWTKSKDCKLFNMTITSVSDSYNFKTY